MKSEIEFFQPEQIEVLKETFDLYQKKSQSGINSISLNEFQLAYQFLTGKHFSKEQLGTIKNEILSMGGKQEDGVLQITFDIFKSILGPRMKNSDSEIIQELFQYFDKTNDGYIGVEEIRLIFQKLGENFSREEVGYLVDLLDLDRDGRVSFEEFKTYILKKK